MIGLITVIAEQTNLPALNATIAAARAGEAGKQIAVVSGRVLETTHEMARETETLQTEVERLLTDGRAG